MKIIGYRQSSFVPKDGGDKISGYTFYLTDENPDVTGVCCDHIFVSDHRLNGFVPSLGAEIQIIYNKYGKVSSVLEVL